MNIVRAPRRDKFAIIPNATLDDSRLSYRARGLLAYLLAKPDGWKTDSRSLAAAGTEGRDAIRSALAELEATGYLIRQKLRGDGGRWVVHSTISDTPSKAPAQTRDGISGPGTRVSRGRAGRTRAGESGSGQPGTGIPGPKTFKNSSKTPYPQCGCRSGLTTCPVPNCRCACHRGVDAR